MIMKIIMMRSQTSLKKEMIVIMKKKSGKANYGGITKMERSK